MRRLALPSLALALALLLAACGGGSGGGPEVVAGTEVPAPVGAAEASTPDSTADGGAPDAPDPSAAGIDATELLGEAVAATTAAGTARFAVSIAELGNPTMGIEGVVDLATADVRGHLTLPPELAPLPGADEVEVLAVDGDVYVGFPAALTGADELWLRVGPELFASEGLDGSILHDGVLDHLADLVGAVADAGPDEVAGVATRRYDVAIVDAAFEVFGAPAGEVDASLSVWIDESSRIRRSVLTVMHEMGTVTIQTDLLEFGVPLDRTPPSDWIDGTDLFTEQFQEIGESID